MKVGRLSDLNDPMDCSPRLVNYPARHVDVLNDKFEQEVIIAAAQTMGLLCFSEAVRDPVVWSHYADCHRGIALGFIFRHGETVFPVRYQRDRAQLDYNALTSPDPKALANGLEQGFTAKASSWSYEKEHRIFVRLDSCKMVGEHYFLPIPKSAFIQVVLGIRCPFFATDIVRLLGDLSGVQVLRAQMNQLSYAIDLHGECEKKLD